MTEKTPDKLIDFDTWFKNNELRFAHSQFNDKQIAYAAYSEGA